MKQPTAKVQLFALFYLKLYFCNMRNFLEKLQGLVFILLACVLVFSFAGCQQNKTTISGTFDDCDKRYFVLMQMLPDELATIDTVLLLNGTFNYRIKTEQVGVYIMQLSDTIFLSFIADVGEKLVFSGNFANLMNTYNVTGSEETTLLLENRRKLDTLYLKTAALSKEFVRHAGEDSYDSVAINRIDSIYADNVSVHKQYLVEFILTHSDKLASLLAFYQTLGHHPFFLMEEDAAILQKIYPALSAKYPNSVYIKDLQEKLKMSDD